MTRAIDPGRMPRPFGPYQLLRRIAVGGMAEVYVALARGVSGFEKLVALKLIHTAHSEDEHFVRMLVDEAKLSVLLTHANIAQTFDLGSVDGRFFIVMEFVEGVDASRLLDRLTAKKATLPIEAALFIGTRVCQALDYAHRKTDPLGGSLGVIHRDVSPQNVLVSREGEVKLTDFGIAKAALRSSETEVGVIKGKYCYMSPEQAWADPIDHRSDIFSAGAVIYELLTGHMLFSPDDNLPALLERVRRADVKPPSHLRPEIPPELDAIVLAALARKPADRYESAGDLANELERQLWLRDRTWGAGKLAHIMAKYVPTDDVAADSITTEAGRPGRMRGKSEGTHATMNSREFMPETSTSILFRLTSDGVSPAGDSERPGRISRTSSPSTLRDVVERTSRQSTDPRVERAVVPSAPDDEEEATTFFSRADFAGPAPAAPVAVDDESTLIDATGDLAKRLDEMISLGGARPAKMERAPKVPAHVEQESENVIIRMTAPFKPPKPLWAPLPFVGPPLGSDEDLAVQRESSPVASQQRTRIQIVVATAVLAGLAIGLGAWLALH